MPIAILSLSFGREPDPTPLTRTCRAAVALGRRTTAPARFRTGVAPRGPRGSRTCRGPRRPAGSRPSTGKRRRWASGTAPHAPPGERGAGGARRCRRSGRRRRGSGCGPRAAAGPSALAREHEVAEPRREALELSLDPPGHVHGRAVRDVGVGPQRVPALRRPPGIEQALLRDEHERAVGMTPARHLRLGRGDLRQRPAQVHRRRARALGRAPGDGPASA